MKSSPLKRLPRKAPKTLPGATLRWSMAKPVTSESLVDAGEFAQVHGINSLPRERKGSTSAMFGSRLLVGPDAEHRRDPADGRSTPPARRSSRRCVKPKVSGGGLGLVEHHDHHIARLVHREHAGEARDVDRLAIAAADHLLGGAGLAADPIAGRIGLLAGALGHDQAQQRPHLVAGFLGEDAVPGADRMVAVDLEHRRRAIDAAVEQGRIAGGEVERRDGDAMAEADGHRLDRTPVGARSQRAAALASARSATLSRKPIFLRNAFCRSRPELVGDLRGADVGAFLHDLGDRAGAAERVRVVDRAAVRRAARCGQLYIWPIDLTTPESIAIATVNGLKVEPSS